MNLLARATLVLGVAAMLAGCSSHSVAPQPPTNAPAANESLLASREAVDDLVSPLTPHVANEYPLPGVGDVFDVAKGSDGFIWFSDDANNLIGRITSLGLVSKFTIPGTAGTDFPFFMTPNIDGNLWIVHDYANKSPAVLRMDRIGHFTEFSLGALAGALAKGITHDVAGDLWIALGSQSIVRMNQLGTIVARYSTPTPRSSPFGMCDFNGLTWITERGINKIAAINSVGNFIGEFPIPTANARPGPCVGLGNYVYFPEPGAPTGKLGRINIASHVVTEVSVPNVIYRLAVGPNNQLWMTQGSVGKIARYDPSTGIVTQFPIPTARLFAFSIAEGGDGNMWFAEDEPTVGAVCTTSSPCKMAKLIPH